METVERQTKIKQTDFLSNQCQIFNIHNSIQKPSYCNIEQYKYQQLWKIYSRHSTLKMPANKIRIWMKCILSFFCVLNLSITINYFHYFEILFELHFLQIDVLSRLYITYKMTPLDAGVWFLINDNKKL